MRILYYDCAPYKGSVTKPVSAKETEFKGKDTWLDDLERRRLFAVRRGVLKFRGWRHKSIPISGRSLKDSELAGW